MEADYAETSRHGARVLIVVLDKKALSATQKYMQEFDYLLKLTSTCQVGCKCMWCVRDGKELAVVQENIKLLLGTHEYMEVTP